MLIVKITALACFGIAILYFLTMTAFEFRSGGMRQQEGRVSFFRLLNKLSGTRVASALSILSGIFLIIGSASSILILLIIIDFFAPMGLATYYGAGSLEGTAGTYFVVIFIAGLIGDFGLTKIHEIFRTLAKGDIIFVTEVGTWGSLKSFQKS